MTEEKVPSLLEAAREVHDQIEVMLTQISVGARRYLKLKPAVIDLGKAIAREEAKAFEPSREEPTNG